MSKNDWLEALNKETRENVEFAYNWAMSRNDSALPYASLEFQKATKARRKTRKANENRKMRDSIMRSCGLTKVYGSVSGKVYWE